MTCPRCGGYGYVSSENMPSEEWSKHKQHVPKGEVEWWVKCERCNGAGEVSTPLSDSGSPDSHTEPD